MSYILRDLPSLMLTWENMSTVFTAKFRSIKTLWKFIVECNEYLTRDPTGVTFVKMFFHPVTIYNEKHFTKWDDEGPVMLENIVDLIRKKEWDFHNFLPILNLWLAIFVKSIDLTHPECKEHIEILFQKSKLWSSYDTCLNEKLQQLFVEKCSKLSIDRFSDLILLGHFDKVEIYKTFLNSLSYSVKQENSIMHLLCLASKYFIEQDDPQEIFLLFFYNIGSYYVKSKRSFEFIKKILEAKIFMTESYFDGEFGKKFKNFIIDSKLQKEIYNKIFSAFDKVVVHDGAFQYEVIKVLLQEVIFSVGPVTNDAVSFFRPIFSRDCDFTVKVRAALIVFGKVVLSQSPSIEWFRDNTTKLCLIAQLISNFTSDNLAICIPESRILKNIITQFISLLRKIFDVMETKHITFGQLVVLSEHYLTYKTIYDCTLKFEYSACCAIAEERISKAIEFQSKILKLLVKEHAYGGYVDKHMSLQYFKCQIL
ncbi:PREDICTED: uncharacterized protein LOC109583968 [Amphimedon queenslandica]|uniref:Uncharacterized protein n=1 Tax=Amphimedon queenslandica TaxID=400682 RepID=A0AAN0JE77_AMPQE|nr:PREDICTED: uncharacterized protein LOC109583968 [Amphimedon queenslandica]|eukprot:XP_019855071.1 PREDICTED: uncharacterized protein LOC109583968 [Amphimedon queenslandica]